MNFLWSNGVKYEYTFVLFTDGMPYTVKASSVSTAFFPKLLHLTCLAHNFRRVSETIRCNYAEVDRLIEEQPSKEYSYMCQFVCYNLKKYIQILINFLNLSWQDGVRS